MSDGICHTRSLRNVYIPIVSIVHILIVFMGEWSVEKSWM